MGTIELRHLISNFHKVANALLTRKIYIECDGIPYEFHSVPLRKILNWVLVEASIFVKPESPWGWPTHLQVEASSFCNLKCKFCPVPRGMNRSAGHMGFDTFKKVIDEVGEYVLIINLWDWGEPLLNPSVYDMITYAKKWDLRIISSTNGHPLAKGNNAEKLVRSGIDSIIFAVDGITQETYERYRGSGDLKTVLAGIEKVVAAKRFLSSETPLVNFRYIVMKHNEHEVPLLKDFARSLGVDALTIKTLNLWDRGGFEPGHRDRSGSIPESPQYQRFKCDSIEHLPIRRRNNPCKVLWNNPDIHWDGKVTPCTYDPHETCVLGDLKQENFKNIWTGASYRKFRRRFRKDYQLINICSECSYAFEGGSCSTDVIVESHFFNKAART